MNVTNEESFGVLKSVFVSTLHVSESFVSRVRGVSWLENVSALQHRESVSAYFARLTGNTIFLTSTIIAKSSAVAQISVLHKCTKN
jgi:hypothetical protein